MCVERSSPPAPGPQATGPSGQGQLLPLRFPLSACVLLSSLRQNSQLLPVSCSSRCLMPVLLSLGGGGTRVGS